MRVYRQESIHPDYYKHADMEGCKIYIRSY